MPLDPSIILGAKSPQFDMAQYSPLNAFTTAMKLRQLDDEGQLNALTLKERKGLETFLKDDPDLTKPETRYALATKFGEAGRKLSEGVTNIGKAQTEEAKRRNDLVASKTGLYRDALIDVNDQRSAIKWLQTQQNDPDMLGSPVTKISIMDAARSIPADPQGFAQWKQQAALGLGEYIKQNKPSFQQINRGGQTDLLQTPGLGGTPTTLTSLADVPLPPAVQAQKMQVATASAPKVTYGPQEKAEKIKYGELLIDDFKNIKTQAAVAARSLPAIESNLAILDKGFDTGFGTETVAAGAKVLGALGVQDAKNYATDAQTFLASASAAVLQRQLEQKGPQTESDAQRITATGAQLGNTKDANKFVLNVAKAQLQRDLKQREFYAAWREKNKTFEGAEDAWYAGDGGKSLFESPVLKKYGTNPVDQIPGQSRAAPSAAPSLAQERAAAAAAIAAGAPPAAVRQRFKQNTGQEF
jgi:hypothetical protein